jgi:hypothetical protein
MLPVAIPKDAPAGSHNLEVEFELTNFHTGADRNLTVRLPLRVNIEK